MTMESGTTVEAVAPAEASRSIQGVGKHTLIYGLGIVLGKGIGFLMLPVYTRFLTPADYGVMELIEMTLELVSIVAGAQLALGVFRFFHKARTQSERNAVISTALVALATSYGLVGIGGFLAAGLLSSLVFGTTEHTALIRIASASMAFQSLTIVPFAYDRVRDRSTEFVIVNLIRTLIALSLNIVLLVMMGMGIKGILISSLIANVTVGSVLTVRLLREVGFSFSRQATRDLLRYGVPMMGTQIATFAVTFGDRYFLQATGDTAAVGLYSLSYQFGFLVALFGAMPFMRVWDPKRFAVAHRADRDEVYARGFIYLNVLLITIALGIAIFVGDLLRVMTTPAFFSASQIVPIIIVAYVLQSWTGLQDIGILVKERTEYVMLANWLSAVAALTGYALLIPVHGGWGAAIATLIAFAVRHITIFTISQRLWPVRYRWSPVLRLLGLATATYVLSLFAPSVNIWLSLLARSVLMGLYLFVLWHMDILSARERTYVGSIAALIARRLLPLRRAVAEV